MHVYLSMNAGEVSANKVKRFFKMKEPEKMPERMKRQQVLCTPAFLNLYSLACPRASGRASDSEMEGGGVGRGARERAIEQEREREGVCIGERLGGREGKRVRMLGWEGRKGCRAPLPHRV